MKQIRQNHYVLNNKEKTELLNIVNDVGERLVPGIVPIYDYLTHLSRYVFFSKFISKSATVLDAACGTGYGSYYIADKCGSVIGLDSSSKAINYAKTKYLARNSNITFEVADLEKKISINTSSADVVFSFETIEHLHDTDIFLKQCHRILKDGGILILSTPNKNLSNGNNPHHINELYLNELLTKLSRNRFLITGLYGQDMLNETKSVAILQKIINKITVVGRFLPSVIKTFTIDYFLMKKVTRLKYNCIKSYRRNPDEWIKSNNIPIEMLPKKVLSTDFLKNNFRDLCIISQKI